MASQHDISKMIVEYLCERFNANMYHSAKKSPLKKGYLVRYSHPEIRNNKENWAEAEQISLYIGEKNKGKGRSKKIAIPDIALLKEDDKKIKLLVEVETGTNFKKLLHSIGPIAMADVYTPSYKYPGLLNYSSDGNDYFIEKLVLFVLVLGKKREQYEKMRKRPICASNLNNSSKEVSVYFDYADAPAHLFSKFKDTLKNIPGYGPGEEP